ncbi:MAG: S-layer homology domain-containing protein, partial [Clostridia bacterium]|nr:S-layer homology domain-containing protein [Clostridia bacterium]
KVNAAGIMTGTDKGFEPSKSLTRAEAAAIIVRMKGISESAVKTAAGTTLFNDVAASHWASGYVNQASNLGIVKGVSATEFAPDREVTVAEFTTMAVRALGAGQLVDSQGTWPVNYVNFANENGILDDVNAIYTATASRMNAATIVANTLETTMWEKVGVKSNGEIEWGKTYPVQTIRKNVLKLADGTITVSSVSNNDHKVNGNKKVNEKFDLTNIKVGLTYNTWVNEDKVICGLWLDEENTVNFTAIAKCTKAGKVKLVVDGEEVMYTVATKDKEGNPLFPKYSLNEELNVGAVAALVSKNANMFGTAYLNDDDDEIISLYATEYAKYAVVDEVTSNKVKMDKDVNGGDTAAITFDVEDNEYFLTKNNNGMSFSDLKEGDAIAYYTSNLDGGRKYVGEVITDSVEGKVSTVKDNSTYQTITISGTKYDVIDALYSNTIKPGDEIEAWLNRAGKVVMFKEVDNKSVSDVAIISYFKPYADKYGWANAEVKLTYMDGTTSDLLTIDVLDTIEELYDYSDAKEDSTKDTYKADNNGTDVTGLEYAAILTKANAALGQAVCYEVSGDKVTFKAISSAKDEEFYTVDAAATLTVAKKTAKISAVKDHAATPNTITNVYVTEDTTFIKVKEDGTYGLKVEVLSYDDLDDVTTFAGDSFVVNYDEDEKTVDAVIFGIGSTITKSGEANLAFIADIRNAEKVDGEKSIEVDVIYLDGKKATLTAINKTTSKYDVVAASEGKLVDLSVKDDVISDIDLMPTSATEDFLATLVSNVTVKEIVTSRDEITFSDNKVGTFADDVLVLQYNSSKKTYTVKSVSDLEEYEDSTTDYVKVSTAITLIDQDEKSTEIVLVVYTVVDKTELTSFDATEKTTAGTYSFTAAAGEYFGSIAKEDITIKSGLTLKSFEVSTKDVYHDTLTIVLE